MSFARPTLLEIVTRVSVDFVSRLELEGAVLLRSMVRILSLVIAGAAHMLHGHLAFLGRQLFPDQSDEAYLLRQASLYGLTKTPAEFATGTADITGSDGSIVEEGTILVDASGNEYETYFHDVTISAGVGLLLVRSLLAGAAYTLAEDQVLSFQSPISGVDSSATCTADQVDGVDEETTEALRVRLLERMAEEAHGGTEADYVAWAKEVPGVTRAWVTPLELGPGTVVVRFVRDNDVSPIPSGGEVTEVQDHLDEEAPAHATVTAVAPTDAPIAFTIHPVPDTSATRAAISAELTDLLLREAEPGGTILLSALRTAVGTADGLTDYTMTVPSADVTSTSNQLRALGVITWT